MEIEQSAFFARTSSALWQNLLRRSVRLHLALREPEADALEVEAHLQLVEFQLMRHLVLGEPTPEATAQAQAVLTTAQAMLLSSTKETTRLVRELSAKQAATPLLWAALPC